MASYDTVQEAGAQGIGAISKEKEAKFFIGTGGKVTPVDDAAKRFLEAANRGFGLKPGDEAIIVEDVAANPGGMEVHREKMDGGFAITIRPK